MRSCVFRIVHNVDEKRICCIKYSIYRFYSKYRF